MLLHAPYCIRLSNRPSHCISRVKHVLRTTATSNMNMQPFFQLPLDSHVLSDDGFRRPTGLT